MVEVIPIRRREAAKSDTARALAGLTEKEASGELEGSILIGYAKHGTEFHVLGACAERLQLGVLAMVKGLSIITDKIVATGTAGSTRSDSVNATWEAAPKRRTPRRLIEATELGDLE